MATTPPAPETMSPLDVRLDEARKFNEHFEGPEKTVTIEFRADKLPVSSLREYSPEWWQDMLDSAKCVIMSHIAFGHPRRGRRAGSGCTAYLLSESSLFVYDRRIVIKTCGTTTPLLCVPALLDKLGLADAVRNSPSSVVALCTYTRLAYLRPTEQHALHADWDKEVAFLTDLFPSGHARILAAPDKTDSETSNGWLSGTPEMHLFVANHLARCELSDHVLLECFMTELDEESALRAFGPQPVSSPSTTTSDLFEAVKDGPTPPILPIMHAMVEGRHDKAVAFDDKFFEPVGYSANGLMRDSYLTVHATPQPCCSYMSFGTNLVARDSECQAAMVRAFQSCCPSKRLAVFQLELIPDLSLGADSLPRQLPDGLHVTSSASLDCSDFTAAMTWYEQRQVDNHLAHAAAKAL